MFIGIDLCQTQIHIHIDSLLISNSSNDEALETLSNSHPIFSQKIFLSHLEKKIHRMPSSLTRSDQFLVDRLTTFIHTLPYS